MTHTTAAAANSIAAAPSYNPLHTHLLPSSLGPAHQALHPQHAKQAATTSSSSVGVSKGGAADKVVGWVRGPDLECPVLLKVEHLGGGPTSPSSNRQHHAPSTASNSSSTTITPTTTTTTTTTNGAMNSNKQALSDTLPSFNDGAGAPRPLARAVLQPGWNRCVIHTAT